MLSTEEIATRLKVKPGTVRRGLCVSGHYLGIKPIKLPNGRLLWPDVNIKELQQQNQRRQTVETTDFKGN